MSMPLSLLMTIFCSAFFLGETTSLGSILGSILFGCKSLQRSMGEKQRAESEFGTAIIPLALIFERKKAQAISFIFFWKFFLSLIGVTIGLNLVSIALVYTTPTLTSAISNSLPVATFLFTVLLRMETVTVRTVPGIAKLGGLIILCGLWLVLQAQLLKSYPAKLTFTSLQCLLSAFQSFAVAVIWERDFDDWKLWFNAGILAVAYCGVFVTAVSFLSTSMGHGKERASFSSHVDATFSSHDS